MTYNEILKLKKNQVDEKKEFIYSLKLSGVSERDSWVNILKQSCFQSLEMVIDNIENPSVKLKSSDEYLKAMQIFYKRFNVDLSYEGRDQIGAKSQKIKEARCIEISLENKTEKNLESYEFITTFLKKYVVVVSG